MNLGDFVCLNFSFWWIQLATQEGKGYLGKKKKKKKDKVKDKILNS